MAGYITTASGSIMELASQAAAVATSTCASVAESLQVSCQAVAGTILSYKYQERSHTDTPDFPDTLQPVWLLGRQYSARHDLQELRDLVQSRFWFTYRKDFPPIGSSGVTSDQGWGCMLRCGQMVLGSALIDTRLGRDWRWNPSSSHDDPTYRDILAKFQDNKSAPYSIHQISLMGESVENKPVGTWFGPNTVAQVLRKLLRFDPHNELVIHVAMDNTLILSEVKEACLHRSPGTDENGEREWRPLLLFVSLRLGLAEINPVYFSGLKTCFSLPQTQGVIGGRPNHALYLLGCVEDEVFYLDPHVTQPTVNVNQWSELLARTRRHEDGIERAQEAAGRTEEAQESGSLLQQDRVERAQEAAGHLSGSPEAAEHCSDRDSVETAQEAASYQASSGLHLHSTGDRAEEAAMCPQSLDLHHPPVDKAEEAASYKQSCGGLHHSSIVDKAEEADCCQQQEASDRLEEADSVARYNERRSAEEGRPGGEEAEGELLYREREEVEAMDRTFHSLRPGRLNISELDPSLSLCFLCPTEEDFDNLCIELQEKMMCCEKTPLFEMLPERPPHMFPPSSCDIPVQPDERTGQDYEQIERKYDSEEEFEIL